MEGNQISPPSLSKRDIARVLFKRKWTIISLYGIILVVCGVYAFFWPPTYTASAKILVKNDRQESVLSADRDVLKTLSKTNVTESDLNTEIDLLTSHDVLKETVIQLHLDQMSEHWLVRLINIPANLFWSIYNNYHSQENSSSIDLAIKKLKNKFSVLPQKKSNIIEVYLDWSTRDGASQILDKIISVYLSHQLEKMKTPDTQSFFTDQVKKQKEILNNLEDEIAKVAEGSTVDSLSLKINLNIESIENLEREISNERANQNKFKAKIAELEDQLSNTPPMVLKSKTNSYNQWALGEMKIALLDLEKERSNLAKQYSPDNRLVQINSDKIENSKKTLQSEMENPIIETTMMKNNVVETLEPNLLMAKSEFAASQSYEKSLTEQIDDLKKQQSILNQQIRDLKTLSREHRIAEENYLTYQKQYEQSRIESAMN